MSIGLTEGLLILLMVLIIFGAGKLPRVMGDLGKGIRAFKANLGGDKPAEEVPPPAADTIVSGMGDADRRP